MRLWIVVNLVLFGIAMFVKVLHITGTKYPREIPKIADALALPIQFGIFVWGIVALLI